MDYDKKEKIANRVMAVVILLVIVGFLFYHLQKNDYDTENMVLDATPTPTTEATAETE